MGLHHFLKEKLGRVSIKVSKRLTMLLSNSFFPGLEDHIIFHSYKWCRTVCIEKAQTNDRILFPSSAVELNADSHSYEAALEMSIT